MEDKTNVMRMLDKLHIPYRHYTYPALQALSGVEVAQILNRDPAQVFKVKKELCFCNSLRSRT